MSPLWYILTKEWNRAATLVTDSCYSILLLLYLVYDATVIAILN